MIFILKTGLMKKILFYCLFSLVAATGYSQTAAEWYAKGNDLKLQKNIPGAINAYKEAVKADPGHKDSHYELGWCYNDSKKYTEALAALRKARSLKLNTPKLFFETGYAFEKLGLKDSALANYDRCLALKPDYSLVYKQKGTLAYEQEDYETMLSHFKKYEQYTSTPNQDYLYWYRKGFANNALKRYDSAVVNLKKSLEFRKDYINTYLELGFASNKLKQNDIAIGYFQKAMDIDPKSHIPYNGIAEVYRDNIKDIDQAMSWYKKSLDLNATERKASFGMGYCLNSKGRYTEAITYLKQAIASEADYTAAYVELGYSYYMTNDNTKALETLQKAWELNPSNENSRYYAGLVYISQKDKVKAQQMVDMLKSLNSKNANTLQEKVNKL